MGTGEVTCVLDRIAKPRATAAESRLHSDNWAARRRGDVIAIAHDPHGPRFIAQSLVQCLIAKIWSRGTSRPGKSSSNVVRRRQARTAPSIVPPWFKKIMSPTPTPVQTLEAKLNARWKNINDARELSIRTRSKLRQDLTGLDSDDSSVVISGSLARDEFTSGSDIDWTLLIDGQADPNIIDILPRIQEIVSRAAKKPPGREGTFGTMAFSHDLIHQMGGEDDTNRNTTRRILLLLESSAVGRPDAYERVIKSVLRRYINEDDGFRRGSGKYHVPRFLQNDFARYWRTMAVDFAYKRRSRFGHGAAMRNFKLRMSRKLIYVSGLLTCFSCELRINVSPRLFPCPAPSGSPECVACLRDFLRLTPLEILATTLLAFPHLEATALSLFNSYDQFLGLLADQHTRDILENLPPDPDPNDTTWGEARRITHEFRDALLELFFDEKSRLYDLTKMYGVF